MYSVCKTWTEVNLVKNRHTLDEKFPNHKIGRKVNDYSNSIAESIKKNRSLSIVHNGASGFHNDNTSKKGFKLIDK